MLEQKKVVLEGKRLMRLGFETYALREGTKSHLYSHPRPLDRVSLQSRARVQAINLGIKLGNGLMIVDTDSEAGEEWCHSHGIISPMMTKTRRGIHRYLRHEIAEPSNKIKVVHPDVDLIFNGHATVAPSVVESHEYEWLAGPVKREELPMFPDSLLEKPKPKPTPVFLNRADASLTMMRNYISKIVAVEGQGGDKATFRVACKICEHVASYDEAMREIMAWNTVHADPPWSEKELSWKIHCAMKKVRRVI